MATAFARSRRGVAPRSTTIQARAGSTKASPVIRVRHATAHSMPATAAVANEGRALNRSSAQVANSTVAM